MYQKIKELCKEKKISINKLEQDLEFSRGYLCKLDASSPSVEKVKKIADYLRVDIQRLL